MSRGSYQRRSPEQHRLRRLAATTSPRSPDASCRQCGDEIRWYAQVGSPKRLPLNPSPDRVSGTVRLIPVEPGSTERMARVLRGPDLHRAMADGQVLWRIHFETCPWRADSATPRTN